MRKLNNQFDEINLEEDDEAVEDKRSMAEVLKDKQQKQDMMLEEAKGK